MRPDAPAPKDRTGAAVPLIFPWRGQPRAGFTALLPIALATLAFAFLLGLVRVKVSAPQFKMANKASWIQLPASGDGVSWALRAQEGGPLLARYEPSDWPAYAAMAAEVLQATRIPPRAYVAELRGLPPEALPEPQVLADRGAAVLPRRAPVIAARHDLAECKLAPQLYPLSAVGAAGLPQQLPPFVGVVDAATEWRFLLRLNPAGGVADAVALTKAAGAAATAEPLIEAWLRRVSFDPKLAAGGGWLAVGIQFNNQPIDGTDPH